MGMNSSSVLCEAKTTNCTNWRKLKAKETPVPKALNKKKKFIFLIVKQIYTKNFYQKSTHLALNLQRSIRHGCIWCMWPRQKACTQPL